MTDLLDEPEDFCPADFAVMSVLFIKGKPMYKSGIMKECIRRYGDLIEHIEFVKKMDCGQEIYGGGALVSDAQAEKVKAEKVKAERSKSSSNYPRERVQRLNMMEAQV